MNEEYLINQLDEIIETYYSLVQSAKYDDLSDLPETERQSLVTRSIASISRLSGINSPYSIEINRILITFKSLHVHTPKIIGVVKALREDIKRGYVKSIIELLHAEIFTDYLEMAQHLIDNGYKDSAAIITGSTLESHLRKIAKKHNMPTIEENENGNRRPLKTDYINSLLAKEQAYPKLDQKNITAWLDLRNKAAHGHYNEYTKDQVILFISSVRDFITRNPA